MEKINSEAKQQEHLTLVGNTTPEPSTDYSKIEYSHANNYMQEFHDEPIKKKKRKGLFRKIKELYGFSEKEEDLEFVYSYYSAANEKPSFTANALFYLIISIFTAFLLWAAFAEIDELARGNGKIIPTDKIQTVQSLDGGIISEISVKEGQVVKKGDP